MAMQIVNLAAGSGTLPAAQEPGRERRVPMPVGQKVDNTLSEAVLPGGGNASPAELQTDLTETASALNRMILAFDRRLQFVVDQESHEVTVKIIDRQTDKVIRVLPPEELQRLHNGIRENMGFLFDRTV